MKGVELPINVLVIVAIAVIVLLGLIALLFAGFSPFSSEISLGAVKTAACSELTRGGCTQDLKDIFVNFDADEDGTTEETAGDPPATDDNLDNLCLNYYNAAEDSECRVRVCGCPS